VTTPYCPNCTYYVLSPHYHRAFIVLLPPVQNTVLIKKSFRTCCILHRIIIALSTTGTKLPHQCSSNITTVLLLYLERHVRNIGHGRE